MSGANGYVNGLDPEERQFLLDHGNSGLHHRVLLRPDNPWKEVAERLFGEGHVEARDLTLYGEDATDYTYTETGLEAYARLARQAQPSA